MARLEALRRKWIAHKNAKAGASLAYYSIFSMGPLIGVVISIVGLFLNRDSIQQEVSSALQGLIEEQGAASVGSMLNASNKLRAPERFFS